MDDDCLSSHDPLISADSIRRQLSRRGWRHYGILVAASLALTLVGCGGGGSSNPTPTVAPTETVVPAAATVTGTPVTNQAPQAAFGEIVWATSIDPQSKAPIDRVDQVPSDVATIYAVIPIARVAPGTELTAEWTYNDTAIEGVGSSTVTSQLPDSLTWAEFHLQRSDGEPWPTGAYSVAIRQNGQIVAESTVEVGE